MYVISLTTDSVTVEPTLYLCIMCEASASCRMRDWNCMRISREKMAKVARYGVSLNNGATRFQHNRTTQISRILVDSRPTAILRISHAAPFLLPARRYSG